MSDIEQLERQLKEAQEAKKKAEDAEIAAIKIDYVWSVEWHTEHSFYCSYRMTDESRERADAWMKDHPHRSRPWAWDNKICGMTYVLIDRYLIGVGGGHVVLKQNDDRHVDRRYEPRLLSQEEADALRAGIVLESVMYQVR